MRLQLDTLRGALTVPSAAVQRGAPGSLRVRGGRRRLGGAEARRGRAPPTATSSAVQGDLHAGDKVVIDGADRLRDGAKVEVIAPAAASAPAQLAAAPTRRRSSGTPPTAAR